MVKRLIIALRKCDACRFIIFI